MSAPVWFETADRSVRMAAAAKRRASCSRASEIRFRAVLVDGNGRDDVSVGRAITELLRSAAMLAAWGSSQSLSGAGCALLPWGQIVARFRWLTRRRCSFIAVAASQGQLVPIDVR